jgi:hypothetical protein
MDVAHIPEDQPVAVESPQLPIWSFLVYMALVETKNIGDDDLRRHFGLPEAP